MTDGLALGGRARGQRGTGSTLGGGLPGQGLQGVGDLERFVDRDEQENPDDGLFSPGGRRALRAAIARRREAF